MATDENNPGEDRVVTLEPVWQVIRWTQELNCSVLALVQAMGAVGTSERAIRAYLASRRPAAPPAPPTVP